MRHLNNWTINGKTFTGNVVPEADRTETLNAEAPAPLFFDAPEYGMWTASTLPESRVDGPWQTRTVWAREPAYRYELAGALTRWFTEEARRRGLCRDGACDLFGLPGMQWLTPPGSIQDIYGTIVPALQQDWFRLLQNLVWEGPISRPVDSFLMTAYNPWFARAFPDRPSWREARRRPFINGQNQTGYIDRFEQRCQTILQWMQGDATNETPMFGGTSRLHPVQWMWHFLNAAWELRARTAAGLLSQPIPLKDAARVALQQGEAQLLTTFRPLRPWSGMEPHTYLTENHALFRAQAQWLDIPLWRLPGLGSLKSPQPDLAWQNVGPSETSTLSFWLALAEVRASFAGGGGPLGALTALYRDFTAPSAVTSIQTYREALTQQTPDQVLQILATQGSKALVSINPYLYDVVSQWPDLGGLERLSARLKGANLGRVDPAAFWVWAIWKGSCSPVDTACLVHELIRASAGEGALQQIQQEEPAAFELDKLIDQQTRAGALRLRAADSAFEQVQLQVRADQAEAKNQAARTQKLRAQAQAAWQQSEQESRAAKALVPQARSEQAGKSATIGLMVALGLILAAGTFWRR